MKREGNCYATSEAVYHLLGGREAGWKPMYTPAPDGDGSHWYLQHERSGIIVDLTKRQYPEGIEPDYSKGKGCGFMTTYPSARARGIMDELVFKQSENDPPTCNCAVPQVMDVDVGCRSCGGLTPGWWIRRAR